MFGFFLTYQKDRRLYRDLPLIMCNIQFMECVVCFANIKFILPSLFACANFALTSM